MRRLERFLSFLPMVVGWFVGAAAIQLARAGWPVWALVVLAPLTIAAFVVVNVWVQERLRMRGQNRG